METHSVENLPIAVRPTSLAVWQAWIRQQFCLLPELFVLVIVLGLHFVLGAPPWLALLGLMIVGWFGARLSILILARRSLSAAVYPRADRLSEMALTLNPYSADAHALRGTVALAQDQREQALYHLEQATQLAPQQAVFHTLLSAALLETNQDAAAQRSAKQALALNPSCAMAHLYLAEAATRQGNEVREVEAWLQVGLKHAAIPADQAALRCALADLLHQQGRNGEANLQLAAIPGLLAAIPRSQRAGLHFYLGQLLQRNGASEAAHEHFTTCVTLDPQGRFATAARQRMQPEARDRV